MKQKQETNKDYYSSAQVQQQRKENHDNGLCFHLAKVLGEQHPPSFPTYSSSRIVEYFPLDIIIPSSNQCHSSLLENINEGKINFPFVVWCHCYSLLKLMSKARLIIFP
jgi:hypothetical protein